MDSNVNYGSILDELIPPVPESPVPNAFSQLSGSLSSPEASMVRQSLSKATKNLANLRSLLPSLESAIESCLESIVFHQGFIEDHSKALSCGRFPAEVWREIFQWSVQDQESDDDAVFRSATPLTSPLILTGVSRTWRNIAVHSPAIWSRIDLKIGLSLPPSKLSLLHMWLTRSASTQLNLQVIIQSSSCPEGADQVIRMLASHADRWTDIYFKLPSAMYTTAPFPLASLDSLESAAFETSGSHSPESFKPRITSSCPKLCTLQLENFRPSFRPTEHLLPLHSVQYLDFGWQSDNPALPLCYEQDVFELLASAESLQELIVSIKSGRSGRSGLVRHEELKKLEIYGYNSSIFGHLDLAALESLKLRQSGAPDPDVMKPFFSRSVRLRTLSLNQSCDLTFLANASPECQAAQFIFRLNASIEQIDPFLDLMKKLAVQSNLPLFPTLKDIKIALEFDEDDYPDEDPALITAVQNSLVSLCRDRLKQGEVDFGIRLTVKGPISDFTINALAQLREMDLNGLDVFIASDEVQVDEDD